MTPQIQTIACTRYRCFREAQTVSLAPLTLLYGENNSGKSALVRLPQLLAASRTSGQPGLALASPVLRGAGFRQVRWGGPSADVSDKDLVLGFDLSDGQQWRWTLEWKDLRDIAVIRTMTISAGAEAAAFNLQDLVGQYPKDAIYDGPNGPTSISFDGLIPRAGVGAIVDQGRDALNSALDRVVWLGAMRKGPSRGGVARGTLGILSGDGEGAEALVLAEGSLRQVVSKWFQTNCRYGVEAEDLGGELRRLVLQPVGAGYRVPFPDVGEGLQQAFPLVVALERLRREGGLLSVEEPESHLHPRLQRALAELVVSVLVEQPAASVLLETHSEIFLIAALRAAAGIPPCAVRVHWIGTDDDGAASVEEVPLDADGRPITPRLERAFETMGAMRRELLQVRRARAGKRSPDAG